MKIPWLLALIGLLPGGAGARADVARTLPVVPLPREMEQWAGTFPLPDAQAMGGYWPEGVDSFALVLLRQELAMLGITLRRTTLPRARLLIGRPPPVPDNHLPPDPAAYQLVITSRHIWLSAAGNEGLFYGVQTLRQLLRAYAPRGGLPCLRIADYPAGAFRGISLESRRWEPDQIRRQIGRLAELKINLLQAPYEPDPAGADEWPDLVRFAARHHIQLIRGAPDSAATGREDRWQGLSQVTLTDEGRLLPHFGVARRLIREAAAAGPGLITRIQAEENGSSLSCYWYLVAFAADQSWQPGADTLQPFDRRFSRGWYGDPLVLLPRLITQLDELAGLAPAAEMTGRIPDQLLLPAPGQSLRPDTAGWLSAVYAARRADRLARTMESETLSRGYLREDLPYWRYAVDRYLAPAETRQQVLTMAEEYLAATGFAASRPDSAIGQLNSIVVRCLDLIDRWDRLAQDRQHLQQAGGEGRAMAEPADPFAHQIRSLQYILIELCRIGAPDGEKKTWLLPPLRQIGLDVRPLPVKGK